MKPFKRFIFIWSLLPWRLAFCSKTLPSTNQDLQDILPNPDPAVFLQVALETKLDAEQVFMHVPYNFGHTVEKVAFAFDVEDPEERDVIYEAALAIASTEKLFSVSERLAKLQSIAKNPKSKIWGHLHPELQATSNVTGCPLYFTPGKHWPADVAQNYFNNGEIFGILRDPYERLVAMFRGDYNGYGGFSGWQRTFCDVDGAIKQKMEGILSGDIDPYAEGCTFLPQAEFFDAPYGIQNPVDNRYFASSANEFLKAHGFGHMYIETADIMHVEGCNQVWAGDLSCETKALVRKVYARDFELLCHYFGYCDVHENTCLQMVPDMCPTNLTAKKLTATYCG